MDLRQTVEYGEYMRLIGWEVVELSSEMRMYLKKLPLLPVRVGKVQRVRVSKKLLGKMAEIITKRRLVLTYVEMAAGEDKRKPVITWLRQRGFRPTKGGMLPTKTRVVKLNMTEKELLTQMKAKTRYNIGLAQRKGLITEILRGDELESDNKLEQEWFDLLGENFRRLKMGRLVESWARAIIKAFGKKAMLVIVRNKSEKLLAGALFLTAGKKLFYSYNGSINLGRKLMAPTLAVWEGIKEAKKRGYKVLDFDGVYDERHPVKGFEGFSRFKAGFGGREVTYGQAWWKWGW